MVAMARMGTTVPTDLQIHQLSTPGLGDQSYLVVSTGEAAVVDPQRDVDRYLAAIEELGVRVVAVLETHCHNDYVSGGPGLARRLGCRYLVPAGAGYAVERDELAGGDAIDVGSVRLRALFTPGHTPHHLSYEVVEGGRVQAVLSGGSMLVGACGRTDLISPEQTEGLTRLQYRSVLRIGANPDPTPVGPTHGAGSFCTASAVAVETWTTVGKERTQNPGFLAQDEATFVRDQLAGLSPYPTYYLRMADLNRRGAAAWTPGPPGRLTPAGLERLQREGVVVVDTRLRGDFAREHVPGSINVELDDEFGTYLGWLWPEGTRFALVLAPDHDPVEPARQCARIGIDTIEGHLEGGIESWRREGRPVSTYQITNVDGLRQALEAGAARALDVRQDDEWREGRVPGAAHVHVSELPGRTAELAGETPVCVYCRSGHRAAMGASLLDAAGVPVLLIDGGFPDWRERGYPVETD
jgi:hydroxyacylglutathione hydrolase